MTNELVQRSTASIDLAGDKQGTCSTQIEHSTDGNVSPSYHHHRRFITAGEPLILPGGFLKWYELRRGEGRVSRDLVADARSLLAQEVSAGRVLLDYGIGFVVLHYSPPLIYLIVGSWRQDQEFWETLYTRDLLSDEPFKRVEPDSNAPTLCIWELAPVWHERRAWSRVLYSPHDTPATRSWVNDCLSRKV